jgi:hypothetical protein
MELCTYKLARSGDRPLRFTGYRLAEGESGSGGQYRSDWTRGVIVRIYRVAGESFLTRYVVHRDRWSRWEGETGHDEALVVHGAEALLAALRDEDGELRRAELEAWETACALDHDLTAIACEDLDIACEDLDAEEVQP